MRLVTYDLESIAQNFPRRGAPTFGALGAEVTSIEYDILHNKLGWSDAAIRTMGQDLVDDIIGDYGVGVERRPGQVLSTTDPTKVTGTAMTMREPTDVARETFNRGVVDDLSKLVDPTQWPDMIPDVGKYAKYAMYGVGGLVVYKILKTLRIL